MSMTRKEAMTAVAAHLANHLRTLAPADLGGPEDQANLQLALTKMTARLRSMQADLPGREKKPETAGEFEAGYAERSRVTVEALHRYGRYAEPCNCGQDDCEGWAMGYAHEDALDENEQRAK